MMNVLLLPFLCFLEFSKYWRVFCGLAYRTNLEGPKRPSLSSICSCSLPRFFGPFGFHYRLFKWRKRVRSMLLKEHCSFLDSLCLCIWVIAFGIIRFPPRLKSTTFCTFNIIPRVSLGFLVFCIRW